MEGTEVIHCQRCGVENVGRQAKALWMSFNTLLFKNVSYVLRTLTYTSVNKLNIHQSYGSAELCKWLIIHIFVAHFILASSLDPKFEGVGEGGGENISSGDDEFAICTVSTASLQVMLGWLNVCDPVWQWGRGKVWKMRRWWVTGIVWGGRESYAMGGGSMGLRHLGYQCI